MSARKSAKTTSQTKAIAANHENALNIETSPPKLATAAPASDATQPHDAAERRQVTVMFSDLVGSTALSARMDPEDLRDVISAYQKCVAETARRFEGFVAKYMDDGVLIYFGYPQGHEDDAERAVRAGLEVVTAVARLKAPVSLQTRIGIATGLVVVGDLIGSGERKNAELSARRQTSRRVCKGSPNQTWWSLLRGREGYSVICSSLRTSRPSTSRASPGRYVPSRP